MEQGAKIDNIERRVEKLELFSHPPNDWEKRIQYLEDAYMRLYDLMKEKFKGE